MTTIAIEWPEELAAEARPQGLLTARAVEAMIRDALRRRAREVGCEPPPMTMADTQGEVDAVRAERRRRAAGA